jgi:hypothetical protein
MVSIALHPRDGGVHKDNGFMFLLLVTPGCARGGNLVDMTCNNVKMHGQSDNKAHRGGVMCLQKVCFLCVSRTTGYHVLNRENGYPWCKNDV